MSSVLRHIDGLEQGNRGDARRSGWWVGLEGLGQGSKFLDKPLAIALSASFCILYGSIEHRTRDILPTGEKYSHDHTVYVHYFATEEARQRDCLHRLRYVV